MYRVELSAGAVPGKDPKPTAQSLGTLSAWDSGAHSPPREPGLFSGVSVGVCVRPAANSRVRVRNRTDSAHWPPVPGPRSSQRGGGAAQRTEAQRGAGSAATLRLAQRPGAEAKIYPN